MHQLLCENGKIIIPKKLQKQIMEWYHKVLCHPRETRMEMTISQHLTWKSLCKTVHDICLQCDICQRTKRNKKKYGYLQAKEAEVTPWDTLCIDMIGPYNLNKKGSKPCI